jgi:hypothetical protein
LGFPDRSKNETDTRQRNIAKEWPGQKTFGQTINYEKMTRQKALG